MHGAVYTYPVGKGSKILGVGSSNNLPWDIVGRSLNLVLTSSCLAIILCAVVLALALSGIHYIAPYMKNRTVSIADNPRDLLLYL